MERGRSWVQCLIIIVDNCLLFQFFHPFPLIAQAEEGLLDYATERRYLIQELWKRSCTSTSMAQWQKNCRSEKKLCLKEGHLHVKLHCGGSFLVHLYSILMCYFNFSWRVVLAYGLEFNCTLTESIVNLSCRWCEQTCWSCWSHPWGEGQNVVLESKHGSPKIINDGVIVAKEVICRCVLWFSF